MSAPTPGPRCRCSRTPTGGATKPSRPTPPSPPVGRSRSSKPATARTPYTSRVETRIRHAKDTGIGRFPSREYAINQAWAIATSIAADLIAWLRLLALPEKLHGCEPKALRYRLLHVPARLTHGARKRRLRFPATWPWATDILTVFTVIRGLTPLRT